MTSRPRRPLDPDDDERERTGVPAARPSDEGAPGSRPVAHASDEGAPESRPGPRSSHDPAPANDAAAPPSSEHAVVPALNASAQPPGEPQSRVRAALTAFLAGRSKDDGYAFIRRVIVVRLYGKRPKNVDETLVDDIAGTVIPSALTAGSPPLTVGGIKGWTARLTRCRIADYFRDREDDDENLAPDVDPVDWSDRHARETDWDARAHLITKFMWQAIGGDERKAETLRILSEHENDGHTLAELAQRYGTSERALANRFHKLRKEIIPKVAIMDREKPRRAILLLLLLFGLAAVAVALWLLLAGAPAPQAVPAAPAPSAVAPPGPTSRVGPLPVAHPRPDDDDAVDGAASDAGPRR